MNEKKLTIKDIAAACGVSTATVSYVLNGRQEQRISEETSKKILHYVQMHGYESSPVARALASGNNNAVGLYISLENADADQSRDFLLFARGLAEELEAQGCSLRLLTDACLRQTDRTVDAIVALNVSRERFYKLGDNCFYPLLCVDGLVNDPTLFYQVYDDYAALCERARCASGREKLFILAKAFENSELNMYISACFDGVCFFESDAQLADFVKSLPGDAALLAKGTELFYAASALSHVPVLQLGGTRAHIELPIAKKCRVTAGLVRDTIRRSNPPEHDVRIK